MIAGRRGAVAVAVVDGIRLILMLEELPVTGALAGAA